MKLGISLLLLGAYLVAVGLGLSLANAGAPQERPSVVGNSGAQSSAKSSMFPDFCLGALTLPTALVCRPGDLILSFFNLPTRQVVMAVVGASSALAGAAETHPQQCADPYAMSVGFAHAG